MPSHRRRTPEDKKRIRLCLREATEELGQKPKSISRQRRAKAYKAARVRYLKFKEQLRLQVNRQQLEDHYRNQARERFRIAPVWDDVSGDDQSE